MRDYFRPFLLKQNTVAGTELGDSVRDSDILGNIKVHGLWALAVGSVGFACWKAGQWYAGYQLANKKN